MEINMSKYIKVVLLVLSTVLASNLFAQSILINESFDNLPFPPSNWDTMNFNTNTPWIRRAPIGGAHTGSYTAFIRNPSTGAPNNNNWLILPNYGTILTGDSLIFWFKQYYNTVPDTFLIKICTTANRRDTTKYLTIAHAVIINEKVWERRAYSLNAYAGHSGYLAFHARCGSYSTGADTVLLDDVVVKSNSPSNYTITATASSGGSITPSGSVIVNRGHDTTFAMTPYTGYHIDSVKVDSVNQGVITNYTFHNVIANYTIAAYFSINTYTLTIDITGNGSVAKLPNQSTYTYGTWVKLTATADPGWTFSNWSTDLTGSHNPDSVQMNGHRTVGAVFTQDQYTLTIDITGNGSVAKLPNQSTYTYGTWVKLTATADPGWTFSNWSTDLTGSNNPDSVYMDGNKTVGAVFTQDQYTLTIDITGNGSVAKLPNQSTYTYGTWVKLTATADPGWTFNSWSDDLTGSNNPDSVQMNGNRTVGAVFTQNQHTLTINISGSGTVNKNPNQSTYTYGTWVKLTALPNSGWYFVNWSDSLTGSNNPDSILMNSEKIVTAHFATVTCTLTVKIVGHGTVVKIPNQFTYSYGTWVQINAIPDIGWHFVNWTGDLNSSNNPELICMNGNKTITANFAINYYTLTVNINPTGTGNVTKNPDQPSYAYGTLVYLTANPDTGWHFMNWSDSLTGTLNPDTIRINSDKVITAHFVINSYTLHIDTIGNGGVTVNPASGPYNHGTYVKLNAIPNLGWHFVNWSDSLSSTHSYDSIKMTSNKIVKANFAINIYTLHVDTVGNGGVTVNPASGPYNHNTYVKLTAIPNLGWHFMNWSDSLSSTHFYDSIKMNSNKVVTVNFAIDTLTITSSAGLNGSIDPLGITNVTYGGNQAYTITPEEGYHVDDVVIDGDSYGAITYYEFTDVIEDHTISATFVINAYTLNIAIIGNGAVIKNPNQVTYEYGTNVALTAIPANDDWAFTEWSGDISSSDNPVIVTMDDNKHIIATFAYIGIPGWIQKESMPPLTLGSKHVRQGGALVGVTGGKEDGSAVYAFRGTKTNEFKKYTIGVGSGWANKESTPFGYKRGVEPPKLNKKNPGKGAAFCFDGVNTIYATKGNNIPEFWAYRINDEPIAETILPGNTWIAKAYVPVAKGLKGGTSIRWYNGKVYLLAGGQKKDAATNFYVYDPFLNAWSTLTSTPVLSPISNKLKPWRDGSSIVELDGTIYAIKGGDKANLFYAYDFNGDTWMRKEDLPIADTVKGKYKKKVLIKDGGATASGNGIIYAIKGGGTDVFWQYTPSTPGEWTRLQSIPALHKKSYPKLGAALAFANSRVWLLKGNKTPEFWRYTPHLEKSNVKTQNSKVKQDVIANQSEIISNLSSQFAVSPNPFSGHTTIHYTVSVSGKVSIKLYNASGRLIETMVNGNLNAGTYSRNLLANKLAKGVYFVKYESDTNKSEVKLIVQ